ncbi:hypothetical protein [Desulfovibrio porci]|uniref:hypothetical protein n=2 Tax=Desulfovibrio TaxID=872 RepID=UPI003A938F21
MRNSFAWLALCVMALVAVHGPARADNFFLIQDASDMSELFREVNATPPSNVSVEENSAIIRERVACFARNFSYVKRAKICMDTYQRDIVATARANVSGRPEIGPFVKNIEYCPVMYNLCEGQVDAQHRTSPGFCIRFERQCIDYMLDKFWRGVPLYDNLQLRIE